MPSLSLLIKPASAACNLRCRYCFYRDEAAHREAGNRGQMSRETLEILTKKALEFARGCSCTFAFQGGEPTLAGLDFFREAVALQKKYNPGNVRIQNVLQTNGTVLNQEWADFLRENQFLVGLSLDGGQKLHDRNRLDSQGNGTWAQVLEAVRLLQENQVEFNILTVVTKDTASQVPRLYRFFREQKLPWLQFIPCLEPLGAESAEFLTAADYGKFLKNLFDLWYRDITAGKFIYIQYFENLVGLLRGCPSGSCSGNGFCSIQNVIEADGAVYPCDFYALDQWKLGDIQTHSFRELQNSETARKFVERSRIPPEKCQKCQYYPLCRGGCRRDYAPEGVNRFCEGFRDFFAYALPRLQELAFPSRGR